MMRFFGMLPTNEIEITKTFKDDSGYKIRIDAGKNGYVIIYADCSSEYEDIVDTSENNLKRAINILKSHFDVTECN